MQTQRAFTLIEVLVVVAILGVLAAGTTAVIRSMVDDVKITQRARIAQQINQQHMLNENLAQ